MVDTLEKKELVLESIVTPSGWREMTQKNVRERMKRALFMLSALFFAIAVIAVAQNRAQNTLWVIQEPVLSITGHYIDPSAGISDRKLPIMYELGADGSVHGTIVTLDGERDSETGAWDVGYPTNKITGTWTFNEGAIEIDIQKEMTTGIKTMAHRLTFPEINGLKVVVNQQPVKQQ